MIDWTSVITTSLTGSAILGIIGTVVGFIFKSIVNQWLSRDIERYKLQLQANNEKEIDRFRFELQRAAFEHQTRFSRLHEKRADVIADLYKYMVETEKLFASMTSPAEFEGEPSKQEKIKKAAESARSLTNCYEENKIYFDEELSDKVSVFIDSLRRIFIDFSMISLDQNGDLWRKANEQMSREIPIIKREVEREFRDMLGNKPTGPSSVFK